MSESVLSRFLRYVRIDTQSDENAASFPSTEKQKALARILAAELSSLGAADVFFDETFGYVYAKIPATDGGRQPHVLGFIAHMDTSPAAPGAPVSPQVVTQYDGGEIPLSGTATLSPEQFPELRDYIGKTLVTTDGTTLLGADDKAGVAEIMTMAAELLAHPEIPHGPIAIAFTPDEEVGAGVDHFDLSRFGADYAYTVDGGALGEVEYENFNAAGATISFSGISVHPGDAKNKMKNAAGIAMEFAALLPRDETPETTEGYEGFFHLTNMEGETERASLSYIIRDHDRAKFEDRKVRFAAAVDTINERYGAGTACAEIRDSYYNMREKIEDGYLFLVENAKEEMRALGVTPRIQPIRGGTDGARLSYMGLPCPNLCTGGHNFHGRFEYCCVESMEIIVALLVRLARRA